ncbi:uncharacterized protein DKFZp434B061-like [Pipra filicauda]|uniref:Uncharacterized protein DKFZp434B061-like n=1 Tax=Pipra filicauda TaxID=649802 RepID=A0A7R5L8K3_9PASS|nr:uncharacterized protein DKFZp434B061-like [Pipra filicauda]
MNPQYSCLPQDLCGTDEGAEPFDILLQQGPGSPYRAEPDRARPSRVEPSRAVPHRTPSPGPHRAESRRAHPIPLEPRRAEPCRAVPVEPPGPGSAARRRLHGQGSPPDAVRSCSPSLLGGRAPALGFARLWLRFPARLLPPARPPGRARGAAAAGASAAHHRASGLGAPPSTGSRRRSSSPWAETSSPLLIPAFPGRAAGGTCGADHVQDVIYSPRKAPRREGKGGTGITRLPRGRAAVPASPAGDSPPPVSSARSAAVSRWIKYLEVCSGE